MPLVNGKIILDAAREGRFAVGAFNADNMELVQAILETAQEERAPVIVQIGGKTIPYAGMRMMAAIVRTAAAMVDVPVVLHLDHGSGFEQNVQAVAEGFESLMYDGSRLPYEENVAETARIAAVAHAAGVPLEAELGVVLQRGADPEAVRAAMTDPNQAAEFVRRTGCDALAVAVGSVHQMRGREADLDVARIAAISRLVRLPLVLHGASGVKHEYLADAIAAGVAKINVATYVKEGFTLRLRQVMAANPDIVDLRQLLGPAREAAKERVREKMRVFGASGRIGTAGFISRAREFSTPANPGQEPLE